jgi:hypothetical protein
VSLSLLKGCGSVIGPYRYCLNLAQYVFELNNFQAKVLEVGSWKFHFLSKEPEIPFQVLDFRAYNIKKPTVHA